VRILRQREYDNAELYSDTEQAMVEKKARGQEDFIEYTLKKTNAPKDVVKGFVKGVVMGKMTLKMT
jgi:hypothetical protein